jgi:hypothetical protein
MLSLYAPLYAGKRPQRLTAKPRIERVAHSVAKERLNGAIGVELLDAVPACV